MSIIASILKAKMSNCLPHLKSLSAFETYRDTPEAFAYLFYSIAKFLVCLSYVIVVVDKYTYHNCSQYIYCIVNNCIFWCWKKFINVMYLIVGAIYGAPLGIVERSPKEYEQAHGHSPEEEDQESDDKDVVAACLLTVCVSRKQANKLTTNNIEMQNASCTCKKEPKITNEGTEELYIRGNKLETNEVLVLAAVTVPFLIAIVTTFWDRFSLEETYVCTEDPQIHCFPLAIPPTTDEDLNISHSTPKISDCSKWVTSDISANVTFRCFKCVNNVQDAFAALGGLLSIFKIAIKIGFAILLFITKQLIKVSHYKCSKCCACCKCIAEPDKARLCFKWIRICFALILALFEVGLGFTIGASYAQHWLSYGTLTDHKSIMYKVFEIFNEPLVALGVVTTSLLLPLENYIYLPTYEKLSDNTDSEAMEPLTNRVLA